MEIKFKAWRKGKVYNVEAIDWMNNCILVNTNDIDDSVVVFGWRTLDEFKLMLYTGLKTDDGVELYHGHVAKGPYEFYGPDPIAIYYDSGCWWVRDATGLKVDRLELVYDNLEVLGTVYDDVWFNYGY